MRNVGTVARRQDFSRINASEQDAVTERYTLTQLFIILSTVFLLCMLSFSTTFCIMYSRQFNRFEQLEDALIELSKALVPEENHKPISYSYVEQEIIKNIPKDLFKSKMNLHDLVQAQSNPWVIVYDSLHKEHMLDWNTFKSFVHCERFRPDPQGNHLDSSSLFTLQACYRFGVNLTDIEEGIHRNEKPEMRYDLENLYITCEQVFNANLGKFTRELYEDYKNCKDSRALNLTQIDEFEKSRNRRH
ncbi:hypothetical protein TKK_0010998 [Trichogramma kaykai]|uniref:Uncharacterized protein n=1 Tax=Trichogramma kaykai TaxID=54128 RepID=A0ABD2WVP8_9HYME